jgi:phage-related protein
MPFKLYFYASERGTRDVRSFLRSLPPKHRLKCITYLKRVREQGTNLPSNIVKHIEAGLWEARPEFGGIEYRFLFFIHSPDRIGVVNAIIKKRDRLERRVIEASITRMNVLRQTWREADR